MSLADNKPVSQLFKQIDSSLDELDTLEQTYQQQKSSLTNELDGSITKLAQLADTKALRAQIVRELYWNQRVSSELIGEAFGLGKHTLIKIAGPMTMSFPCLNDCGKELKKIFKSRARLKYFLRQKHGHRAPHFRNEYLCEDCSNREFAENEAKEAERRAALRLRDEQLRNMPWAEFVDSREWRTYRNYYVHSVGYHCEFCHTHEGTLHIHLNQQAIQGHPSVSENQFSCSVLCTECREKRCGDLINPDQGEPLTREFRGHIMNWNQGQYLTEEDDVLRF